MKNVVYLFFAMLFLASCQRDRCKDIVCGPNQICLAGSCVCADGFEGADCATRSASKYIGNYVASEFCQNGGGNTSYFPFIQQQSSNPARLEIGNFLNNYTIVAFIRADAGNTGNNIEIPEQQLGGSGTIYGQGVLQFVPNTPGGPVQQRLTLNLEYTLNFQNLACTHTFFRQ